MFSKINWVTVIIFLIIYYCYYYFPMQKIAFTEWWNYVKLIQVVFAHVTLGYKWNPTYFMNKHKLISKFSLWVNDRQVWSVRQLLEMQSIIYKEMSLTLYYWRNAATVCAITQWDYTTETKFNTEERQLESM